MKISWNTILTATARLLGVLLLAAGSFYFWKFGIGPDPEDKSAATMFGATPILYGLLLLIVSFRYDAARRSHILTRMIGIPIVFAVMAFIAALLMPNQN